MTILYQIKSYLTEAEAQLVRAKAHAKNMGLTVMANDIEGAINHIDGIIFEIEKRRVPEMNKA